MQPHRSFILGVLIFAMCVTGCERADPLTSDGTQGTLRDIRINEVHEQEQWVEFVNTGDGSVDLSDGWICIIGVYNQIRELNVIARDDDSDGDLTLDPGEMIAVEWDELTAGNGAVSFYRRQGFSNEENIVDYVRWGKDSAGGREGVAGDAGIWTTGDFLGATAADATVSFFGESVRTNDQPGDWNAGAPTPAAPNTPF